jgi:hypothetical protein
MLLDDEADCKVARLGGARPESFKLETGRREIFPVLLEGSVSMKGPEVEDRLSPII